MDNEPSASDKSELIDPDPAGLPGDHSTAEEPTPVQPMVNQTTPMSNVVYVSNPFLNAAQGLVKVLTVNAASAMLSALFLTVLIVLYYMVGLLLLFSKVHHSPLEATTLIAIAALFVYIVVVPFVAGLISVVGAASINDETVSLGTVLSRTLRKLPALFLATVIIVGLTYIGLFLFIVPGLILISRLSLTYLIMFEEKLGPIEAIKKSFRTTKGHTFEMMGSFLASYWLTGGYLLITAIGAAPLVGRYQEIKQLNATEGQKPRTHWLNYGLVMMSAVVIVAYIAFVTVIVVQGVNKTKPITSNATGNTTTTVGAHFVTVDSNDAPFCGNLPSESMSLAGLMYNNAAMDNYQESLPDSNQMAKTHNATNVDITDSVATDQRFIAMLKLIPYPAAAAGDATAAEVAVQNYDNLLTQELRLPVNDSSLNASITTASTVRGQDTARLRQALGLNPSTCSLETP